MSLKANTTDVSTSLTQKEDVANKSNATLGTSTTYYPTQNAVKKYVEDTAVPYINAIKSVNLGNYDLTVNGLTVGLGAGNLSNNTAIGSNALQTNTIGASNTAIGSNALQTNTTGASNTAIGSNALQNNTIGVSNVAIGKWALSRNTTGFLNIAIGESALSKNSTGDSNIANGSFSLRSNTIGSNNTANGEAALTLNTTGNYNTAIGYNSLYSNTIGYYNTAIGFGSDVTSDSLINATAIGAGAKVFTSNTIQLGNVNINSIVSNGSYYGTAFNVTSDKRLKTNIRPINNVLTTIMQLNPVQYIKKKSISANEYSFIEIGFIAQEIKKILPFIVQEGNDKNKLLSINYTTLIPLLTKAIQEQNKQIDVINKKLDQVMELLKSKN